MPWYGIKTIYRAVAEGEPVDADQHYDESATLLEERVILLQAKSPEDAHERGQQEAQRYAQSFSFENPYGQKVAMRLLECCEIYHLFEEPTSGEEVFSSTEIVSTSVSDKTIVARRFGLNRSQGLDSVKKFCSRELLEVPDA